MPGDRRGADPLCWEWGRLGQVAAARSYLAAFGVLFGEACALCCSSSAAEGSQTALPAFLTTQQSKHGMNSALQRLVAV